MAAKGEEGRNVVLKCENLKKENFKLKSVVMVKL